MASQQSTVDFIVQQIDSAGAVRAKKMFGEYGIFCSDKMVALVCDNLLFVKPTETGRKFVGKALVERCPYPGAKPCFLIPRDKWDDSAWLTQLIKISTAALAPPKKKIRR